MKSVRKHIIAWVAPLFGGAILLFSCSSESAVGSYNPETMLTQQSDTLTVLVSQNGVKSYRFYAPLMERYENDTLSYELFPKGISVFGYTEEGLLETEIIADNARHLSHKDGRETWEAFGNVVVKNLINQETMETDTLYWDQKNEKIYTHCYVRMYSPDGFAQGYGMESDQRARHTELFNPFNNYAIMSQDSTKVVIDSVNFIGPLLKK